MIFAKIISNYSFKYKIIKITVDFWSVLSDIGADFWDNREGLGWQSANFWELNRRWAVSMGQSECVIDQIICKWSLIKITIGQMIIVRIGISVVRDRDPSQFSGAEFAKIDPELEYPESWFRNPDSISRSGLIYLSRNTDKISTII